MPEPKLRFKREDGTSYPEWDNKSFSNAFSSLNNNTFSRDMLSENGIVSNIHYGDVLVKFGEVCDIQTADIPKVNADIDTSKYDELQDGDIILADTAEDETVGKAIEIYRVGTSRVISGLHTMACRPNDKYAPKYLGYYINSPTYHNQLIPFMQGIKVTSIGRKNIADTVIYYPIDTEEQQKIADFLSTVDEVIAQSETEVQNLDQQKKAAMQKIFSQEVRFKREDGTEFPEWNSVAFGSLIEEYRDKTIAENEDTLLSSAINGMFLNTELFGHQRGKSNVGYLKIDFGTLILSAQNLHLGNANVNLRFEHGIISPAYKTYHIINCDLRYMAQWIKREETNQFFYNATTVGASQCRRNVDWEGLYQQTLCIPNYEEQQKIADFLSTYDEAISYAKQELNKWKQLKKGLLQQMFV